MKGSGRSEPSLGARKRTVRPFGFAQGRTLRELEGFDSLAKSARSLTVPDLDAKKGRKNRDPLVCPEPVPNTGPGFGPPGAGLNRTPSTRSAESADLAQGPGIYAKEGRKNRDPLWCPEQGTHLTNRLIHLEFTLFPTISLAKLRAARL